MSRSERKGSKVGAFFGGTFFGFLLAIGAIVGVACFIYFKASPQLINKTFKTNISLGSEELDSKTISDLVSQVSGIVKNKDTYTLNDLKTDFGINIKDELVGIKIADLKNVALTDLPNAVEKKFGTISADELRNVNGMNLEGELGHILDRKNTYYYNLTDNKLYHNYDGTLYSNEVAFDYEVNQEKTQITTKGHASNIVAGKVEIQLWYLPITVALGDFTKNMGDNLTLYDLEQTFGVQLPTFLDGVDKQNTTVNELESAIKGLYIADFMNYTISSDKVYDHDGVTEIKGVLARVAKLKVNEIKTEMENLINTLTLTEIFDASDLDNGILSLLPNDTTVAGIPDAVQTVITDTNINTLVQTGVISVKNTSTLTTEVDHDSNNSTEKRQIGLLTVNQFLDFCLNNIDKLTGTI